MQSIKWLDAEKKLVGCREENVCLQSKNFIDVEQELSGCRAETVEDELAALEEKLACFKVETGLMQSRNCLVAEY